jgi:hypothetical protein
MQVVSGWQAGRERLAGRQTCRHAVRQDGRQRMAVRQAGKLEETGK